jgi:hypothetical protein
MLACGLAAKRLQFPPQSLVDNAAPHSTLNKAVQLGLYVFIEDDIYFCGHSSSLLSVEASKLYLWCHLKIEFRLLEVSEARMLPRICLPGRA